MAGRYTAIDHSDLDVSIGAMTADPFARELVLALSTLVVARRNPDAAWAHYVQGRQRIASDLERIEPAIQSLMAAVQSDNWAHLRAHLDDAIDDARQAGLIPATAMLLLVKGDYYWRAPFGDRSSNIERAVEAFLEGFALSSTIPNSSLAIESAQWLAVAYGERMLGDALEDLPKV